MHYHSYVLKWSKKAPTIEQNPKCQHLLIISQCNNQCEPLCRFSLVYFWTSTPYVLRLKAAGRISDVLWRKTWSKHRLRLHWTLAVFLASLTQLNFGQLQCVGVVNRPMIVQSGFQWTTEKNRPNIEKIEITIDFNYTKKRNDESVLNFTKLFLWSLSSICTLIYFIRWCGYNNLKFITEDLSFLCFCKCKSFDEKKSKW